MSKLDLYCIIFIYGLRLWQSFARYTTNRYCALYQPRILGQLAIGHDTPVPTPYGVAKGRERMLARMAGELLKNPPSNPYHLETFRDGSTFDPKAHDHGTVVTMRSEMLTRRISTPVGINVPGLRGLERSLRPTDTSPQSPPIAVCDAGLLYLSSPAWGVVVHGKDTASLYTSDYWSIGQQRTPMSRQATPLTVGKVEHAVSVADEYGSGFEWLSRVNVLHVVARGVPKRRRSRRLAVAAKFALGSVS